MEKGTDNTSMIYDGIASEIEKNKDDSKKVTLEEKK